MSDNTPQRTGWLLPVLTANRRLLLTAPPTGSSERNVLKDSSAWEGDVKRTARGVLGTGNGK
jgi:hypothetical protein